MIDSPYVPPPVPSPVTPPAVAPAAGPEPEEDLTKKQAALKDAQDKVTDLGKTVSVLQAEISALQSKIADVQQVLTGYKEAAAASQNELDADNAVLAQKGSIADAVVKDLIPKLDQKIHDADAALALKVTAADDALKKSQAAAADAVMADRDAQYKQSTYDALKRSPKDVEVALKDVAALLALIAKAETQNDFKTMYFLVGEATALAKTVAIRSEDDYKKALRKAQDELELAKSTQVAKKSVVDKTSADYTAAKQALDAAQKSRRADVLAALKDVKPDAKPKVA